MHEFEEKVRKQLFPQIAAIPIRVNRFHSKLARDAESETGTKRKTIAPEAHACCWIPCITDSF